MNGLSRPHAAMNAMLRLASRVKGPPPPVATASLVVAIFAPLLVLLKRRLISDGDSKHPRASWATICAFADDQIGEAEAGRGPTRTVAVETRYRRYTQWCASRGHTGVDLVLATALWKEVGGAASHQGGVRVALEPNIVPYHAEAGIEHWVMWYDPALVPGGTDLDPSAFATHVLSAGRTRRPLARQSTGPAAAALRPLRVVRRAQLARGGSPSHSRVTPEPPGPRHIWRRPPSPGPKPPAFVNTRCAPSWTWATPSAAVFRTFPSGAACRRSRTRTSSCGRAGRRRRRRLRSCGWSGGCAARGPRPSA